MASGTRENHSAAGTDRRARVAATTPIAATTTRPEAAERGKPSRHRTRTTGASTSAMTAASVTGMNRSEEHTSELQSLMRISYAVFCLKKKKNEKKTKNVRNNEDQSTTR